MWWKKNRWRVIVPTLIIAVLAAAFWYGGDAPELRGVPAGEEIRPSLQSQLIPEETLPSQQADTADTAVPAASGKPEGVETPEPSEPVDRTEGTQSGVSAGGAPSGAAQGSTAVSQGQGTEIDQGNEKDNYLTGTVPEGKPEPVNPQEVTISDAAHTCTISVRCDTVLKHTDWLDPEKAELIPEDGVIFAQTAVTFYEGESVFNVLQRELKKAGVHLEFKNIPMYNSAYIEGIGNLYEFDCGELSGWMYRVNGWFPNYGCSRYQLQEGDVICWVYTCDLGADVGGFAAQDGKIQGIR